MDELLWILIPLGVVLGVIVGALLGWIAFRRTRALRAEVERLAARLSALEEVAAVAAAPGPVPGAAGAQGPAPAPEPSPGAAAEPPPEVVPEAAAGPEPEPRSEPEPESEPALAARTAAAPPPRRDLEETIGSRWAVWVGGLALGLGGIFLVRYSIEAGLLGPAARVTGGLLFAAVLLGLGEWLRRSGLGETAAAARGAYVPGVLTAAGTVAAFASTWAAYGLYGFIGDTAAFLALGAIALATLALALVHGWGIAGLGLAASYATPLLVSSQQPSFGALSVYLLAVTAATLGVARLRFWRWLAATAVAGSVAWAVLMAASAGFSAYDGPVIAAYLAAAYLLAHLAFATTVHPSEPGLIAPRADRTGTALLSLFALPVLAHVAAFGAGPAGLALTVGFGAAAMTTAYMHAGLRFLVIAGIATVLLGYTAFDVPFGLVLDPATGEVAPADLAALMRGAAASRLLGAGFGIGLLFAGLGVFGVAGSAARTMLAVGGAVVPLGLLVLAYLRIAEFEISVPFGFAALLLAGYFAAATEGFARRLTPGEHGVDGAIAVHAVAAVAAVAAGLAMLFERGVLTIALAAVVPAIAFVEAARPVKGLRGVALAVSAVVAARFALDPEVVGADLGDTPVFNWLLWGYGVPAACFAISAWRFGETRQDRAVPVFEALAVAFTALTLVVLVHHGMTGGDIYAPVSGLAEQSLLSMSLFAVALGMQWLAARRPSPVFATGTLVVGALGLALAGLGLLVGQNPAFTGEPIVGGAFDGTLVLGYLAPAALVLLVARVASRRPDRPAWYVGAAAGLAGLLAFAWATLAVRAAWHTGDLRLSWFTDTLYEGELYAYSAVWLAAGVLLLALGAATGSRALRTVSGVLVAAVVAKVFLVDTAELTGALRAASFIGLGAVLVAVGLAYQRFTRPPAGGAAVMGP